VDFLLQISKRTEANIGDWQAEHGAQVQEFLQSVSGFIVAGKVSPAKTPAAVSPAPPPPAPAIEPKASAVVAVMEPTRESAQTVVETRKPKLLSGFCVSPPTV